MNWSSHSAKIANKLSRALGIMNKLKRYLPFQAWNSCKTLWFYLVCSLVLHVVIIGGIGYLSYRNGLFAKWRIVNAHTEPLFKEIEMLKVSDIFYVQCMKLCYKFVNKSLLECFGTVFTFNNELHQIETRVQNQLCLFPTQTISARNVLRHRISDLLQEYPRAIIQKTNTHSIESIVC